MMRAVRNNQTALCQPFRGPMSTELPTTIDLIFPDALFSHSHPLTSQQRLDAVKAAVLGIQPSPD